MKSWYIYAILDALFAAIGVILAKIGLNNINPLTATAIRAIFITIFVVLVSFYFEGLSILSSLSNKDILFIILSAIAGGLSWIFYFIALKYGDVVPVSIIDRSSIIFVIIFSILLLNEKISTKTIIASILIIVGIYLLSI